ncbi:hypothetical protein DSO57_1011809 [Entomophthora muscae]|uniref:Uncharacterized protein n=1 Tax=Entomophthora muscae TaxID=34485 RepID=A0ACC2UF06_9FUNG|nr:hypothetical protein DSO57_1011809 [Entomophthora muscae]
MATMSPANINTHSSSPFSPSQINQDFDSQDINSSSIGGFNEKELLVSQLESVSSANVELSAQLEFLKKKYQGLQDELQSTLQSQTNLEKQYYSVEADLEKAREREEESGRRLRDLEFKFDKEVCQGKLCTPCFIRAWANVFT